MTKKTNFGDSFLNWCGKETWNWALWLQNPDGRSSKQIARYFREWIAEVEEADGTLLFRWIRFTTKQREREPQGMFVLVGGLSGGEFQFWCARWREITGDKDAHAGVVYSSRRRGMRLIHLLKDELGGRRFDATMRVGPRRIQRARTMQVDDEGQPTEKRIERIVRATFLERERLR